MENIQRESYKDKMSRKVSQSKANLDRINDKPSIIAKWFKKNRLIIYMSILMYLILYFSCKNEMLVNYFNRPIGSVSIAHFLIFIFSYPFIVRWLFSKK